MTISAASALIVIGPNRLSLPSIAFDTGSMRVAGGALPGATLRSNGMSRVATTNAAMIARKASVSIGSEVSPRIGVQY
jgi:hypothetical protein